MMMVCTGALTIPIVVVLVFTSLGLFGDPVKNDDILPPLPILMDIVRGIASFAVQPQEQPQAQIGQLRNMPVVTQAYANYAMGPSQLHFSLSDLSFK